MNFLKDAIKGVVIGVANIIPGVSGGTMMVAMGIYKKIISAITGLRKHLKKSIKILLPIIIGMLIGIAALSFVIKGALGSFPLQTSTLFIGMVLGGVPVIILNIRKGMRKDKVKKPLPLHWILFAAFFVFILIMTFVGASESTVVDINLNLGNAILLILVGIIAAATMVIPGVSGSMVLMVLGFYNIIIANISDLTSSIAHFNWPGIGLSIAVLLPFCIGVIAGILVMAKIIEWLFKKFPSYTYFAILGLICASPVAILVKAGITGISFLSIIGAIVTFIIGFFVSVFLGR